MSETHVSEAGKDSDSEEDTEGEDDSDSDSNGDSDSGNFPDSKESQGSAESKISEARASEGESSGVQGSEVPVQRKQRVRSIPRRFAEFDML